MEKKEWQKAAEVYQGAITRLARTQVVAHVCGLIIVLVMLAMGLPVDPVLNIHVVFGAIGLGLMGAAHSVNYMFTLFAVKSLSGVDNDPKSGRNEG